MASNSNIYALQINQDSQKYIKREIIELENPYRLWFFVIPSSEMYLLDILKSHAIAINITFLKIYTHLFKDLTHFNALLNRKYRNKITSIV